MRSKNACQVPKTCPRTKPPIAWGLRVVLQTGPEMSPRACHWSMLSTEHVVCYVVREPIQGPPPGRTDSITQIGSYVLHASDCNTCRATLSVNDKTRGPSSNFYGGSCRTHTAEARNSQLLKGTSMG